MKNFSHKNFSKILIVKVLAIAIFLSFISNSIDVYASQNQVKIAKKPQYKSQYKNYYSSNKKSQNSKPTKGKSVMLMDVATGEVLYHKNGYDSRFPASLTKMMTLYLLFEVMEKSHLNLQTKLTASANAAAKPSTNLTLKAGDKITIDTAIKALIIRSANDVATIVAETLGRTEENFAKIMTKRAKMLGMHNTNFRNASGLPDNLQYSNSYDMAILSRALVRDFPQYYHYFNQTSFTHNGRTYKTHNNLMTSFAGVEGLKTGYIRASGFHLASAYRSPKNGRKLIAIYLGADRPEERKTELTRLLTLAEKNLHHQYRIASK